MIDEENEFPRDYAGDIALECAKIEKTLSAGLEEYHNSPSLLGGKKWYTVALENNDSDKEKDNVNKKNILLRLIDKVINFIKMVGKKIAEWYRACEAAILKFFGKDTIDPKDVTVRFSILVDGLEASDANTLINKMSQESKVFLAELFDKGYSTAFYTLYENYKKIKDKCDNPGKFAENFKFFTDLKESSTALKTIATDNKIYENADKSLAKILNDQHALTNIENMSAVFTEINTVHESHSAKLEQLLNKIASDDLTAMEGNDVDTKRKLLVNLVSDVLKIDSELIMKVNHYMQAIAMLMTYIVKYRYNKVAYIPM